MNIREKLYRDPVHDLITLDKNSAEDRVLILLIDTAEMQRLRRIRQLGLAWFAYQGAEHSRFTHSLGTMWIATRILSQLSKERRIAVRENFVTRCAALLHDIGHGPFSHLFEAFLGVSHETWTSRIILEPACEVHQVLESYDSGFAGEVAKVISGESRPRFLSQLISSQLDADRFDYLLRDSVMTGVKYGIYDLERIIHTLRIGAHGQKLVVSSKGIQPVEQYLQSRYHMYAQVYLHKTVRAAEIMLGKLLMRARDVARGGRLAGICEPAVANLFVHGSEVSLQDFLDLDDHVIFSWMHRCARAEDPVLRDLAQRLATRRLFKTMDVSTVEGFDEKKAAEAIAQAGFDPQYYFVIENAGGVPYKPYDPSRPDEESHILVEIAGEPEHYRDIHDLSEVVGGLARAAFRTRRAVFPAEVRDKMRALLPA